MEELLDWINLNTPQDASFAGNDYVAWCFLKDPLYLQLNSMVFKLPNDISKKSLYSLYYVHKYIHVILTKKLWICPVWHGFDIVWKYVMSWTYVFLGMYIHCQNEILRVFVSEL